MNFKVGDTVRLKSGGPLMTVESIGQSGSVDCTWFDDKNKVQNYSFKAALLEADDDTIHVA